MNTSIKILIGLAVLAVVGEGIYIGKLIQSVNEKQKNIVVLEEAAKSPRLVVDTQKFKNDSTIQYKGEYVTITQQVDETEPKVRIYNEKLNYPHTGLRDGVTVDADDVPGVTNELVSLLLGNVSPVLSCTTTQPMVK